MDQTDNSWDYQLILPIVVKAVRERGRPSWISESPILQILDQDPAIAARRIVPSRVRWCVSKALKALGYERDSQHGRMWKLTRLEVCYGVIINSQVMEGPAGPLPNLGRKNLCPGC